MPDARGPDARWLLVHAVAGREGPGAACTCARGAGCPRPGKHPVAQLFPNGARSAVRWEELAADLGRPGVRPAAALGPGERVLDADTPAGAAALWRAWPEVERALDVAATPRGFHVWQGGLDVAHATTVPDPAVINRGRRMVGGDVKESGYVLWPWPGCGAQRRWIGAAGLERVLRSRFPGVEPGTGRIVGKPRAVDTAGEDAERIGPGALLAVAGWLARQREGDRNNSLNWAAWKVRGLVGDMAWEEVAAPLRAAALAAGLEEREVEATLRSALGDPR